MQVVNCRLYRSALMQCWHQVQAAAAAAVVGGGAACTGLVATAWRSAHPLATSSKSCAPAFGAHTLCLTTATMVLRDTTANCLLACRCAWSVSDDTCRCIDQVLDGGCHSCHHFLDVTPCDAWHPQPSLSAKPASHLQDIPDRRRSTMGNMPALEYVCSTYSMHTYPSGSKQDNKDVLTVVRQT